MKRTIDDLMDYVEQIIAKNQIEFEINITLTHDIEQRLYYTYSVHYVINDNESNRFVTHSVDKVFKILSVIFGE